MGANLAVAGAFSNYGNIWRLKRNKEKTTEYNKAEFANAVARTKFYNEYFTFLSQSKEEADIALLKAELEKQLAKKDLSEADMMRVKNFYENSLNDKEKGAAILLQVKERYPNGQWKRNELTAAFNKAKLLSEKQALYNDFTAAFPQSKNDVGTLDNMRTALARMYADSGDYTAMNKYLDLIQGNSTKPNLLNSIAWKLSGQGFDKKPINVSVGLALSKQSLQLIEEEKKTGMQKAPYITKSQHIKNLNSTYHMFADTYATLLYHSGDVAQAYAFEKAAVEFYKYKVPERNAAFAFLTEKLKGPKEAQLVLEKFLADGKYTPAMKDQLQRLYLAANNNNEESWATYVSNLETMAYNNLKAELAKKMINMPAPQFALKDMSGKEVALSSLKGKIVVVDFWATWCGPCIASFPGMQKAVDKFKDNPDVVFLFIDTWENDSNRVQKVTDFIAKNKYSFNVLYDETKSAADPAFVVVENFAVEGIPTKFVIDGNNNIRFKSVGYSGSADALVSEISAVIDIVNTESSTGAKKSF
jgi:peroxiredoxin